MKIAWARLKDESQVSLAKAGSGGATLHRLGAHFARTSFSKRSTLFDVGTSSLLLDSVWQTDAWQTLESLTSVDAASRDERGQHVQERIAAASIPRVLDKGHTICGDISGYTPVRSWLDEASRLLGTAPGGFAKIYASPSGAGFPMHLDPHHVFVLQCRGSKRWRFGRTPALPNASQNAKVAADDSSVFSGRYEGVRLYGGDGEVPVPDDDTLEELVLQPGDALYLPPGTWHSACAEEFSLAISLSPSRVTPYDLIIQWLDGQSLRHPEWFKDVGALDENIGDALSKALGGVRESLKSADVMTLARQWALQLGEGSSELPDSVTVSRKDVLRRPAALPMIETTEAFVFFAGGQEWSLPLEARPFLEGLRSTPQFIAEDVLLWDENLRWPAANGILDELVRAGVLTRVK